MSGIEYLYFSSKNNPIKVALPAKAGAAKRFVGKQIQSSIGIRIVVIAIVAIALAMYLRLYFGVDVSDEGFYMSMSYLFARGGQPFVHEWVAQQGASIIFSPFVKAYIFLQSSTDGLVLFGRHIFFLISIVASWSVWRLCRRVVTSAIALFPALLPVVFHPGGIPNLSYNSLGALAWLLGLALIFSCYVPPLRGKIPAFSGAALVVIASFCYPSLLPIMVIVICTSFLFAPRSEGSHEAYASIRKDHRTGLLLGTFFLVTPLLYVVFLDGLQPLLTSYEYASAAPHHGGGWFKVSHILKNIIQSWRYGALVLSLLVLFAAPSFPKPWRGLGVLTGALLLLPGIAALEHILSYRNLGDSSLLVMWLGLLSPIFFLFRPDTISLKHLLVIWPLSILAGFATAWTSSQWVNGALGLLPAAILSLFLVVRTWNTSTRAVWSIPIFILVICIAAPQFLHVYNESPLINLRTRVLSGPYQGLYTGWKPVAFYEITADLASVRRGRSSLFILNGDYPGFYLTSDLIPSGPTVWANSGLNIPTHTRMFQEYFSLPMHLPDVVVEIVDHANEYQPLTSWLLEKGYSKQIDKPSYRIYVRT